MQLKLGTLIAVGGAYIIGYSRGMAASDTLGNQLGDGLAKVGEGLKAMALELGLQYKTYQEEKEEFEENVVMSNAYTVEEKIRRMGARRHLYRSDDQIADKLNTTVEDVKRILDEDGLLDIDGKESSEPLISGRIAHPTPEEAAIVDENTVVGHGMSTRSQGEPPDQPGSDAS